jgi:hypothetical protein
VRAWNGISLVLNTVMFADYALTGALLFSVGF